MPKSIVDNAKKVINALKMIEIKKELNDRPQTDVYAQDIQHVFLNAMRDQLELVLPVVNKIVDNVLALSDYTLSIG